MNQLMCIHISLKIFQYYLENISLHKEVISVKKHTLGC